MLNRIIIGWILYAALMGFVVGGSFVAAYQIPLSQNETGSYSEQNPTNQHSKEKTDEALARYTFWLTIVTGIMAFATIGLGIATVGLYVTGEKQVEAARTAADAALRQANAMIAIESPILDIAQLKLVGYENERSAAATIDPVPPGLPPPFCRPLIALQNSGRTAMTINRIFCDWIVAPTVEEFPDYHFQEIWNGTLGKESSVWFRSQNGIRLNQLQVETIENFGQFLWVYGKIVYTDFMGDQFEHGFIARWTTSEGFVRDPLVNYEYKRKI
jgi:hypothetical protein